MVEKEIIENALKAYIFLEASLATPELNYIVFNDVKRNVFDEIWSDEGIKGTQAVLKRLAYCLEAHGPMYLQVVDRFASTIKQHQSTTIVSTLTVLKRWTKDLPVLNKLADDIRQKILEDIL
jgi:hypothetical protein